MVSLFLVAIASVIGVADVPTPRPTGWVSDPAHVLDAATEGRINAAVNALHRDIGVEIAVVTVDDVDRAPKEFASALFRHWGIGAAAHDNGVLVLMVVGRRRLEIETGRGMEAALSSAWLAEMQRTAMVPRFKAGDLAGGLSAGVDAIAVRLRTGPAEAEGAAGAGEYRSDGAVVAPAASTSSRSSTSPPRSSSSYDERASSASSAHDEDDSTGWLNVAVGGLALGGGLWFYRRRRRRRACDQCHQQMVQLDEVADDEHLDGGQRTEEAIGSVNHVVLLCKACNISRIVPRPRRFTRYQSCSQCGYRTFHVTSRTVVAASYDHEGENEATEACHHCHRHSVSTYTTPRLEHSSASALAATSFTSDSSSYSDSSSSSTSDSSGSSGSSGFGGGSSDGGGAGSSW